MRGLIIILSREEMVLEGRKTKRKKLRPRKKAHTRNREKKQMRKTSILLIL